MKEVKVKNVIIGKQFEDTENLQEFLEIIKQKNINLVIVEVGNRINIEKNLYFDVLWPSSTNAISENSINNNALVCKLFYKKFSILFTGDIEEETEKVLVEKYIGTDILQSKILKVAHHGSKSSSTKEFLELVKPQIALIGVGTNNLYGHPSNSTITNLDNMNIKIYRTDEDGEISIFTNGEKYKINRHKSD